MSLFRLFACSAAVLATGVLVVGCGGSKNPAAQNTTPGGGGYLDVLGKGAGKAGETESANNLKQIGLALQNYHLGQGQFPGSAAITDEKGKPLLSWRVAILPMIEQQVLYQQFKLDEPWDSPNNKKLPDLMPKLFMDPRFQKKEDKLSVTYYQGFTGDGGVLGWKDGASLEVITNANGTSNTFLIVEAGDPVPWTKPADLVHDLKKPLPPLGGPNRGDFLALLCNSDVRKIPAKTDEKVLRCMIQWNNKEAFKLP